jgi:hypothetical protein
MSFDLTWPKPASERAKQVFDHLDEVAKRYPEFIRRPVAQKLQGGISLSTEYRRERTGEILAIPSNGAVMIVTLSVINKLKRDANAAFPDDDEPAELAPEASDRPRPMPPKRRRSRSAAQLQALQRENDRRREAKLAKAALVERRESEGSSS